MYSKSSGLLYLSVTHEYVSGLCVRHKSNVCFSGGDLGLIYDWPIYKGLLLSPPSPASVLTVRNYCSTRLNGEVLVWEKVAKSWEKEALFLWATSGARETQADVFWGLTHTQLLTNTHKNMSWCGFRNRHR